MAALLRLVLGGAVCAVGSFCYAMLNILSQLSKEPDGSYAYSMPAVVLASEFVKLCLSIGFLARDDASSLRSVVTAPPTAWMPFAVPSVLYAINNNLDMLNNQYMDPATESVLAQGKILTTGLAWWLVFKKPLSALKWLSLVLLFIGCCGAGWPTPSADAAKNAMYIEPFGLVLVSLYNCISATAGVYNEWLYKRKGHANVSIHLLNIRLYTIGCIVCLGGHWWFRPDGAQAPLLENLFHGFNFYTWAMVANYSVMGLLLSQVLKHFDSLVKLLISGSSMYASAFMTRVIFGRVPSMQFVCSLAFVAAAIALYNLETFRPQSHKD